MGAAIDLNALTDQELTEYLELQEDLRLEQIRGDLNEYCRYIEIPGAPLVEDSCPDGDECDDPNCKLHEVSNAFYPQTVEPAEHHELINNTLMKVANRETCPETGNVFNRVMVFMPPGSAKSTYGTVTFPTWYMGNNPNKNIICTSYATALARKFGRKCRTITGSKSYNTLFKAMLRADNRAVDDWSLTNGSTYMAAGILAGVTGNRADGILIDDPVKGREDADSPTIREKTWEAYLNDIRTRLKPNGFICIIQTRWHEDDLSGRILPKDWDGQSGWVTAKDGEPWYVICLQAECERDDDPLGREIGEWLWTDWFSPKHWEQEKKTQGTRNWGALFQQRPKPVEGAFVKRDWIKRYNTPPAEFLRVTFSLDTAYKEQDHNDPSVLTVWGQVGNKHYLLDVWRDRVEYPELKRILADRYLKWKPDAVLIEDKASGQSLIQECRHGVELPGIPKLIGMPVIAIEPEGNKINRLVAETSQIEAGLLFLPEYAPWLIDYESELFGFPLATHDDQVDSTSQYLRWAKVTTAILTHVRASSRGIPDARRNEQRNNLGISRRTQKYRGF